ncbi:YgeY family selenium metabolism-linked hydrolase [Candidatus Poribacteria bacterium]|nr:YgeY family selenium metabolism-linked hydrolase [Candidatus Poribacteria bacterium]
MSQTAPVLDVKEVRAAAEKNRAAITKFMMDVVSIRSMSCQEEEVIRRVAKEMTDAGFDEVKIDAMGNCLGRIGHGKTVIMMDAHIDTVDIGDPAEWKDNPPYPATFKDGVIYGRGSADQKGGIVGLVYAGKLIKDLGLEDDFTVWVTATCMEEDSDGIALLHIIGKEGLKPDFCVLTDSTDMNLYRGHRGRMEIEIIIKGVSCHGSAPERGDNPVTKAAPIVLDIDKLNHRLKHDDFLGKGTICVSKMEVKTPSLCAVPAEARIFCDRRLTWGETPDGAMDEIRALDSVKAAKATVQMLQYNVTAWTGLNVGQEKFYPTWKFEENHPLVEVGVEAASLAKGTPQKAGKWIFSTNGVACAGRMGIPSIGFGPGAEAVAHTTKEYCKVDDLITAATFYAIFPGMMSRRVNKDGLKK